MCATGDFSSAGLKKVIGVFDAGTFEFETENNCGVFSISSKNGKKSIKNRNLIAISVTAWYTVWA
jgi:hypothetical protein